MLMYLDSDLEKNHAETHTMGKILDVQRYSQGSKSLKVTSATKR